MKRYEELDSLRGLAAMTVFFAHCLGMFVLYNNPSIRGDFVSYLLKFTPLSILISGHEAVILFFVLSGLVLSFPFVTPGKSPSTPVFITKRVLRLYVPYAVAIIFAILLRLLIPTHRIEGFSNWFAAHWQSPISIKLLINHLLFLPSYTFGGGRYDIAAFDSVIWTLIQELRVSIIFPLIMLIVLKLNWKTNVLIGLGLSLLSHIMVIVSKIDTLPKLLNSLLPYLNTIEWIPMFIIGALIGKHFKLILDFFENLTSTKKIMISVGGILLYTYPHWFFKEVEWIHLDVINDWVTLLGAGILICLALTAKSFSTFLRLKPIHHLGKISYSFYLYHMIVLVGLFFLFHEKMPIWLIWVGTLVISWIISTLSYRYIETLSIHWGKRLSMFLFRDGTKTNLELNNRKISS
ncbi:acyltransferase [Paenibacillus filicis]|uniref:Acyltransferase n=1 Tax=Paenibacillus filicis TaxID=669464 RepID=A0ABU9DJF7_9BACL